MTKLPLWERPVNYGAVGATQAPDLLQYPPAGFRPLERRVRIGHGDARWTYAWTQLFTWGMQRLSGMKVDVSETPGEVTALTYTPVGFNTEGIPVQPSTVDSSGDALFGPDGTPFLRPGDTANLVIPFGPFSVGAPVRVVYVIDEPNRKGFAYGTLPGHPESGEEAWLLERSDDGSVWLTIRAFSRPSTSLWWMVYPMLRLSQDIYTRRYERALAGTVE
ncbi:MAG: hypothetical protein QOF79_3037 [Actinomycetota bacterium]|nr:hypothetical protein [Actinomycetota bacterium]